MRSGEDKQDWNPQPGPELPDDLWSTIAGIVGHTDWVRVPGTCKAFWRAQLRGIEVQNNRPEELLWLSKRWSTAQALVIQPSSLEGSSASADAEILEHMVLMRPCGRSTCATCLYMPQKISTAGQTRTCHCGYSKYSATPTSLRC